MYDVTKEITFQVCPESLEVFSSVKLGSTVYLRPDISQGKLLCVDSEGNSLGTAELTATVPDGSTEAVVRTIRRAPSGEVTQLGVRPAKRKSDQTGPASVPPPHQPTAHSAAPAVPDDLEGLYLQREHLQGLLSSEELRATLKDPALQKLLTVVDSSADREKALEQLMQSDSAFCTVADKMLTAMKLDSTLAKPPV